MKSSLVVFNQNVLLTKTGFKICQTCLCIKSKDLYWKNKRSFDGLNTTCNSCKNTIKSLISNTIPENSEYSKNCRSCKLLKNKDAFTKNIKNKDGLSWDCSECNVKRVAEWAFNNKEYNKKYKNKRSKQRRKEDSIFKLTSNIRSLISYSFKRACGGTYKKSDKTENILGCTVQEFINHLESLFTEGMTLENHGQCEECWHIDHKIPISSAKTEEEIIKLNHYTNLQPLWSRENLSKGYKY